MTGRESLAIYEQKLAMLNDRGYVCQVCGKEINVHTAQMAHIMASSKSNIKKYGKEVIHHHLNLKLVCGLKCNSAVLKSPATHPIECRDLVELIRSKL